MEVYVGRIDQVCSAQGIFIRTIVDMYWIKDWLRSMNLGAKDILTL